MSGNNGRKTGRDANGRFASGNPGRPPGSRHKTTLAIEQLLQGEAEGLTRKAIEMALSGDATALRLCLERIAPAKKDTPVAFDLPPMRSAGEAAEAAQAVLRAVSAGKVTPIEAGRIMGLIEGFRRAFELADIEQRLKLLEARA